MLAFLTILIMVAVGYAYLVEGLLTAFLMFCNVVGAGLITFNFYEPVADLVDCWGYEDALAMVAIFGLSLGALRTMTNNLANTLVEYYEPVQRAGGAIFGLATGYLVSGFLICVLQTLPWHEQFLGFNPTLEADERGARHYLPPDRIWLAMMHKAGATSFSRGDYPTFDQGASFEPRYARLRRYTDKREALPNGGEFEDQLRPLITGSSGAAPAPATPAAPPPPNAAPPTPPP